MSFVFKTALRDGRRQSKRLLLCALSIVFGVAALVAVDSFADNLNRALDTEAKALLGADLQISSRSAFNEQTEHFLSSISGEQAREIRFASMAYFPKSDASRLIQLRAISEGFPYYGTFSTEPSGANPASVDRPVIVLDPLLLTQYELQIGDSVRLGQIDFEITASLLSVPGEAAFAGIFAPRAYIPLSQLESTGLIEVGSIARYRFYAANTLQMPDVIIAENADFLADNYLKAETVEDQKEDVGRPLENLNRFLSLVGFIALLLGGVGIAGAAHSYLQQKRDTVAILRCLGASAQTAMRVFLVQIAAVAVVGSSVGVLLSLVCQAVLPLVLAPLLPFPMEFSISWPSLVTGFLYGVGTAFVFGLFPLLPLRKISPLRALRASFDTTTARTEPAVRWLAVLTAILLVLFCVSRTDVWWQGALFAAALGIVLLLLWGIAALLKKVLKHGFNPRNYLLRQAAANLHRPNNRTVYLTVSLGMGTFLIYTLILIQTGLLQQTDIAAHNEEPNLLFFDVQQDQMEGLHSILADHDLTMMEKAPVVTMRLAAIKGRAVSEIKGDPDNTIKDWIMNREWRSSYRGQTSSAEKVIEGDYTGQWDSFTEPIPISLEADIARDMGVKVGDQLRYDVQGISMEVVVSSLRQVDWTELRPNFFATFPLGVLESAPQWWIAVTRSPDRETTAAIQSALFKQYPNVSAVDLNVVIDALQSIFGRINFAIQFMGLFTAATGVIILINALSTSRHSRIRESVLLRTMGASASQIRSIMAIEYGLIGALSGVIGIALALTTASALGVFVFKFDFTVPWLQIMGAFLFVVALALITGMAGSRGIASHPPLAILRKES
ncbi:ABC transporter permease [Coraliomargarita sp. W4R72]